MCSVLLRIVPYCTGSRVPADFIMLRKCWKKYKFLIGNLLCTVLIRIVPYRDGSGFPVNFKLLRKCWKKNRFLMDSRLCTVLLCIVQYRTGSRISTIASHTLCCRTVPSFEENRLKVRKEGMLGTVPWRAERYRTARHRTGTALRATGERLM